MDCSWTTFWNLDTSVGSLDFHVYYANAALHVLMSLACLIAISIMFIANYSLRQTEKCSLAD